MPFVSKIVALDIEPYLVEFAKPFYAKANVQDKIDFRIADAIKTLEDLESKGEGFDLVFIDADKGGYWSYYDKIMSSKTLLNKDGVIIAVSILIDCPISSLLANYLCLYTRTIPSIKLLHMFITKHSQRARKPSASSTER